MTINSTFFSALSKTYTRTRQFAKQHPYLCALAAICIVGTAVITVQENMYSNATLSPSFLCALAAICIAGTTVITVQKNMYLKATPSLSLESKKQEITASIAWDPAGIINEIMNRWPRQYNEDFVVGLVLQTARQQPDRKLEEMINQLPIPKQIAIGLTMIMKIKKAVNNRYRWNKPDLPSEFMQCSKGIQEIEIETTTADLIDLFNKFQVIQLRNLKSNTLVIGCGHTACKANHTEYDTLTENELWRNPTIVAQWEKSSTAAYFEHIGKKYDRILDEGPALIFLSDQNYNTVMQRVLNKTGTLTIPDYSGDPNFASATGLVTSSQLYVPDPFNPPRGNYNYKPSSWRFKET